MAHDRPSRAQVRGDTVASPGTDACGRWGMIDVNPAKHGVANPQRRRTENRPFESWAELEAVATHLGAQAGPMVIFAAATGLRPGEWIALEWRDVDLDERVVYVRRAYRNGRIKHPKTQASMRSVPLQTSRLRRSNGFRRTSTRRCCSRDQRRLLRPAQLPGPRVEAGATGRRYRTIAAGRRSAAHVRDLCAPCRHLHLRALPIHGREPHDDRPPLRTSHHRRRRARRGLLDSYGTAQQAPWTLVDALWTSKPPERITGDNRNQEYAGR